MMVGPGNTRDEDEKEDIPAQKSYIDEEEDFSTDGSSHLYESHTDIDQTDEIKLQKKSFVRDSDEYKNQKSTGSCKKNNSVWKENKRDFIETSPQNILYQEELMTNKFEMNVQSLPVQGLQNNVATFEDNIYNNIIQKPIMDADISNKNFSRMDDWNIGLTHIKKMSGNVTQRSEPIKTRLPEKQSALTEEDFKDPSEPSFEVTELDLAGNKTMTVEGFKNIKPDGFEVITDITDTKFESLRVGLADATMVTELDLAGNKTMTAEGFKNLALFITAKDVKCLNLSGCQLTTESVKLFCDTLIQSISWNSSESSLVELDVSYNPILEPEAYKSLGSMIWKCGVKKISLTGCGLDKYRLSKLTEPKERQKVESLEVADNVSIGKGIIEIAKIVGECDLEILDISDCMLTADDLKDFREALGEVNKPSLIRLDLSDFDRTPDEEYITELCKIFPYVAEELRAQFRFLEIFSQRLMQEKLNLSAKTNLKIILNDDDDDIIWQGNQD